MATPITTDNFREYFLRMLSEVSDSLELESGARGADVVTDITSVQNVLSLPGVLYTDRPTSAGAIADRYVQIPYSVLAEALAAMREATTKAERVNAQLTARGDGAVILTVTNREGEVTEVEVGFRIAETYASVAEMEADAANVEIGRYVLIDSEPSDEDNGKLYVKEDTGFRYLCDLAGV